MLCQCSQEFETAEFRVNGARLVEHAFRQTEIRLISAGNLSGVRMDGAFRQGLAAGDRVNLNRPVADTGRFWLS
jgi:hypothetical protein